MGKFCDNPSCEKKIKGGDYAELDFYSDNRISTSTLGDPWDEFKTGTEILCEQCAREAMESIGAFEDDE